MYNDSFRSRYGTAPVAISENIEHYDTTPHVHGEIELLYLEEGEATVTVSDRSYKLSSGEIIIVNPLDVHSIKAERALPYHQKCICFDLSLIADKKLSSELFSGESKICEHFATDVPERKRLADSFLLLFESVRTGSGALLFECAAYISMIFATLVAGGYIERRIGGGRKADFTVRVQRYLSLHYQEQITSEDAAKEFFYTQSYFCRLFRENFGVSFLEYLSMYRISKVMAELSLSDKKISELSESVGFLDQSYFSRCFKSVVGVSPTEYRKRQRS